jgi:hypothetical protein
MRPDQIAIGSLVKINSTWSDCNQVYNSWGVGIILEYMPPYAKSLEPYGIYNIKWPTGPEANLHPDDCWYSPDMFDVIKSK